MSLKISQVTRLCILIGEDAFLNASLISNELLSSVSAASLGEHPLDAKASPKVALEMALGIDYLNDDFQRKLIVEALKKHKSNVTHTAQTLKLTPRGLRKMMMRLSIAGPQSGLLPVAS